MRYLLALLSVFFTVPALAADGKIYLDAIVICTVKADKEGNASLNLPFKVYGQDVVQNGQSVTYELEKHLGEEVMAKVDYKASDEPQVLAFQGNLGAEPRKNAKYSEKFPKDKDGNTGKFCEALSFQKEDISKDSIEIKGIQESEAIIG